MRRGDPERIYQAQRAGTVERLARIASRERVEVVLAALEADCEALGLERGSPEFWREAERRVVNAGGMWGENARTPDPTETPLTLEIEHRERPRTFRPSLGGLVVAGSNPAAPTKPERTSRG